MSELVSAIDALRQLEDAVTTRAEATAFGSVLRCRAAPTLAPLNFVRVDALGDDVAVTAASARSLARRHGLATIILDKPSPTYNHVFETETSDGEWYRVPRRIYVCTELNEEPPASAERLALDEFIASRRAFFASSADYDAVEAGEEEAATRLVAARAETEQWGVRLEGELASIGEIYFSDGAAQLESLSTLPKWEGRGLGTALTVARTVAAMARGAEIVFAQMRYDNARSIHLHERIGFVEVGARMTFEFIYRRP